MPVVKISDEHLQKLHAIAKAKGTDPAGAFAHAVDLAHRAHVGASGSDGSAEADHTARAARTQDMIAEAAERSEADNPAAQKAATKRLNASEEEDEVEEPKLRKGGKANPLGVPSAKDWAKR